MISIIIPVYNVEAYIEECLRSVFAQTFKNIEIILVNDCSPDRSLGIAKQLLSACPENIKYQIVEHDTNKGLSEARNSGIRVAHGDYIFFLDSDDILMADALEVLYKTACNTKAELVCAKAIRFYEPKELEEFERGNSENVKRICETELIIKAFLRRELPVMSCNKLILRQTILENELWFISGIVYEDEPWSFKLATVIRICSVVDYVSYCHRYNTTSITSVITEKHINSYLVVLGEIFTTAQTLPESVFPELINSFESKRHTMVANTAKFLSYAKAKAWFKHVKQYRFPLKWVLKSNLSMSKKLLVLFYYMPILNPILFYRFYYKHCVKAGK